MKPFIFPLQTILRLRIHERDAALERYAQALQQREVEEQRLLELYDAYVRHQQRIGQRRASSTAGEQDHLWQGLSVQVESLNEQMAEVKRAREEEAQRRQLYMAARARAEALEKLRTRRQDEHKAEGARLWEQEVEDLVNARWEVTA